MIRWVSKGYLRLSLYVILIFEFVLSTFASDLSKAKSICEYFIQFCKLFSFGNNVTILFYTIVVLGIGEHVKRRFDDVDNDPINENAYTEESPQTDSQSETVEEVMSDMDEIAQAFFSICVFVYWVVIHIVESPFYMLANSQNNNSVE